MITRPYLLSTTSSSSSMGGLMIPSRDGVPATFAFQIESRTVLAVFGLAVLGLKALLRRLISRPGRHQGYQLSAHVPYGRVDKSDIELTLGSQLSPRGLQPLSDRVGWLGLP